MIEIIENTIEQALIQAFPTYEIAAFPVDFDNFQFTNPEGCALVRYEKSSIAAQSSTTAVNSQETYNFTVFLALRSLKTHKEAYGAVMKLKKVLNGLEILNKRLALSEISFETDLYSDLWYSASANITLPITDEYEDEGTANKRIIDIIDTLYK